MHVVRHRIMRSIMLSEWVTYDFSTMCSAWHIRVDVFIVFMNSLSHQRKKCTLQCTSKIIYQFLYCHLYRRNYSKKLNCFQSFGFYALFSDCISWYFIDFMELKSKLCAWIHYLLWCVCDSNWNLRFANSALECMWRFSTNALEKIARWLLTTS